MRLPVDGREGGQRFEVRLVLGALLCVSSEPSGQSRYQSTRLVCGNLEYGKLQHVVADHVDEITPPDDTGGGGDMRSLTLSRGFGEIETPELAQLQRGQALRRSHMVVHTMPIPEIAAATRGPTAVA